MRNESLNNGSNPLLELRDVSFAYASGIPVLVNVSIRVLSGTRTAIIGPNGSGKSTLLRLMAGLATPSHGTVELSGRRLRPGRESARRIAYVPQDHSVAFPFTVLEVVLTGRSPHKPRFSFENSRDIQVALECLGRVGVSHLADRPLPELSGGERQLVSIARALAQEPDCLLLDEPSSSLDLKNRGQILRILGELQRECGITTVLVTHDLALLDESFDQILAMREGRMVYVGPPSLVIQGETLRSVYDDPCVRTAHINGRTFVWSGSE